MNNSQASIIAMRLKAARLAKGLTQEQVGILAGIDEFSASTRINRYEKGIHEPNYSILKHIATALDVPVAYFYCEKDLLAELLALVEKLPSPDALQILELAKQLHDSKTKE